LKSYLDSNRLEAKKTLKLEEKQ